MQHVLNIWIRTGLDLYFLVCVWSGDKDLFLTPAQQLRCEITVPVPFFEVSYCSVGGRTDGILVFLACSQCSEAGKSFMLIFQERERQEFE